MPPKKRTSMSTDDIFDRRITALENRVKRLRNERILTAPEYDSANFPPVPVHGQIVLAQVTSSVIPNWIYRDTSWDSYGGFNNGYSKYVSGIGFIVLDGDITGSDVIQTSSDGLAFTAQGNPFTAMDIGADYYGVLSYLNGKFYHGFVKDRNPPGTPYYNYLWSSTDGVSWSSVDVSSAFGTPTANSFAKTIWAMTRSSSSGRIFAGNQRPSPGPTLGYSDDDGATWTSATTPWDSSSFAAYYGADYSSGLNMTCFCGDSGVGAGEAILTSDDDGATWTSVSTPMDGGIVYQVLWSILFSCFLAVGSNPDNSIQIMSSTDGVTWTSKGGPFIGDNGAGEILCLVESSDTLYLGGYSSVNESPAITVMSTQDLSTYIDMACPIDNQVNTLAYNSDADRLMAMGTRYDDTLHTIATIDIV